MSDGCSDLLLCESRDESKVAAGRLASNEDVVEIDFEAFRQLGGQIAGFVKPSVEVCDVLEDVEAGVFQEETVVW